MLSICLRTAPKLMRNSGGSSSTAIPWNWPSSAACPCYSQRAAANLSQGGANSVFVFSKENCSWASSVLSQKNQNGCNHLNQLLSLYLYNNTRYMSQYRAPDYYLLDELI